MPVYEYKCRAGHHYEMTEGFDAPNKQRCPSCGKASSRQLSLPAVIFKGSGFYSTDNRNGNRRNGSSADSGSETSDSASKPSGDGAGHANGEGGHSHDSTPKVEASVD